MQKNCRKSNFLCTFHPDSNLLNDPMNVQPDKERSNPFRQLTTINF